MSERAARMLSAQSPTAFPWPKRYWPQIGADHHRLLRQGSELWKFSLKERDVGDLVGGSSHAVLHV